MIDQRKRRSSENKNEFGIVSKVEEVKEVILSAGPIRIDKRHKDLKILNRGGVISTEIELDNFEIDIFSIR